MHTLTIKDLIINWSESPIFNSLEININCKTFNTSITIDGILHPQNQPESILLQICCRLASFWCINDVVKHIFDVIYNSLDPNNIYYTAFLELKTWTQTNGFPLYLNPYLMDDYDSILSHLIKMNFNVDRILIKEEDNKNSSFNLFSLIQNERYIFTMKCTGNTYELYTTPQSNFYDSLDISNLKEYPFYTTTHIFNTLLKMVEYDPQDLYEVNHILNDYKDLISDFHIQLIHSNPSR